MKKATSANTSATIPMDTDAEACSSKSTKKKSKKSKNAEIIPTDPFEMTEMIRLLMAENKNLMMKTIDLEDTIADLREDYKEILGELKEATDREKARKAAEKAASTKPEVPATNTTNKGKTKALPVANTPKRKKVEDNSDEDDMDTNEEVGQKKEKIPPVILRNKDIWQTVQAKLKNSGVKISSAKLIQDGVAIIPATANDHREATKLLFQDGYEYHTFTLHEERLQRVVLRGIPCGIAEQDILEDLKKQGVAAKSVQRMTNRKTRKPMPLVLVQVSIGDDNIFSVTRCCALIVKTEVQRTATTITQCHRCQRFGHGQARCTATPKCVKCGADHHSAECKKPREEPAKCANCDGEHPANYRGCTRYPKPTRKMTEARKMAGQRAPATKVTHPKTTPDLSYAAATRPRQAGTVVAEGVSSGSEDNAPGSLAGQLAKVQKMCLHMTNFLTQMSVLFQGEKTNK